MISLPQELFEQILFYVPKDLNSLDRETKIKVNKAFNQLFQYYLEDPSIRRFMPYQRNLSERAIVLRTANDIYRFGHLTSQSVSQNFSLNNLHSILERTVTTPTPFRIGSGHAAALRGDVQFIRIMHTTGSLNGQEAETRFIVETACKRGDLPLVIELIARQIINNSLRGYAVITAASEGKLPVIKALLKSGEIKETDRYDAVMKAMRKDHVRAAGILLREWTSIPGRRYHVGGAALAWLFS